MTNKFFSSRKEGQGLVEYALILVLVAIVVIAVLLQVGPQISKQFCTVVSYLQNGDVAFCTGGTGSSGSITNVTASYSARNQKLVITVTVSQNSTVTVTGNGGISDSKTCSGTCTLDFDNPPASGAVTVTDTAGGVGIVTYW